MMAIFEIDVVCGCCTYDKNELARLIDNPDMEERLSHAIESQKLHNPFRYNEEITALTDYLELDTWTPEQAACLVAGIVPKGFISQPKEGDNPAHYPKANSLSGMILQGDNAVLPQAGIEISNEGFFAFHQRERVLELWNSQLNPPAKVSPREFVTWCKSKGIPTQWLAEIVEAGTDTIPRGDVIPGTMPPRAIGQLAIKAAWQIECETRKQATADQVMEKLYSWMNTDEGVILVKKILNGITWMNKKGTASTFTLSGCGRCLITWRESYRN